MKQFFVFIFIAVLRPATLVAQTATPLHTADMFVGGVVRNQAPLENKSDSLKTWYRFDLVITHIGNRNIPREDLFRMMRPGDSLFSLEYYVLNTGDTLQNGNYCSAFLSKDSISACGWKLTEPRASVGIACHLILVTDLCDTTYSRDTYDINPGYVMRTQEGKWTVSKSYNENDELVMKIMQRRKKNRARRFKYWSYDHGKESHVSKTIVRSNGKRINWTTVSHGRRCLKRRTGCN